MQETQRTPLVLRRERIKRDYSLRDLAKIIGVDRSTVSYWEWGLKDPIRTNKAKLARVFDMPIQELLSEDTYGEVNC